VLPVLVPGKVLAWALALVLALVLELVLGLVLEPVPESGQHKRQMRSRLITMPARLTLFSFSLICLLAIF
jgi:hypothetical protein